MYGFGRMGIGGMIMGGGGCGNAVGLCRLNQADP
jgi:hypothetical protein